MEKQLNCAGRLGEDKNIFSMDLSLIPDDKNVTFLLVQETHFHMEISSPAFKEKKDDPSVSCTYIC